jgi:hypothetical protein
MLSILMGKRIDTRRATLGTDRVASTAHSSNDAMNEVIELVPDFLLHETNLIAAPYLAQGGMRSDRCDGSEGALRS